jgi:hypothetical protein
MFISMKKHILPGLLIGAGMLFAGTQAQAQIHNDRGTFSMPTKGDLLVETQATVASGGVFFSLNDNFLQNLNNGLTLNVGASNQNYFPMLKVRKFSGNGFAHRFMLNVSYGSNNLKDSVDTYKQNSFGVALGYGIEKVFTPAERLNTYIGADLMLGYTRNGEKAYRVDNSQSAFGFGVRAFTGMDYYVLPKVYLGIELGYGLAYSRYGEINHYYGHDNITNGQFSFTPYVTPQFRLGYVLNDHHGKRGHHEPSYRSRYDDSDED